MVDTQRLMSRKMDIDRPCAARIYDAFLGGSHNFGVERRFVERAEAELPGITEVYRENRAFVRRAVEYLLAHGVHQFLDLGSGIPTIGHVHEVARRRTGEFRVLYVDNEPLTVAHSRPLLDDEPRAAIIEADCRDPESVLRSPEAAALIDFDRPVALLMSAVLHFVPDRDSPAALVETYRKALAPDSHLAITHLTADHDPATAGTLERFYAETADPLVARPAKWIDALFGDFEVLPPGTSHLTDWRPDPDQTSAVPRYRVVHGGLARKPE
ncbi:SAM-dependent methyltransferase [Saccharopolyspora erythraea]|uniref:SAM-dependent methyltransferase n=1 Tax=Saccharopolyspora erythraea TaxID=1836 RepID=UPI001BA49B60|nr:SAM-dependent methyltransferase [Saccharopolyspora erythraea]QUH01468.1 SAM-dependent methyltransferase [Saccharopolyspora erythraea]